MFSPLGGPDTQDQQDIDWADDLKFFIRNNNKLLSTYILPAAHIQQKHKDSPNVHLVYIKPLKNCIEEYCRIFEISDKDEIFNEETINDIAKSLADEQRKFIDNGDYEVDYENF